MVAYKTYKATRNSVKSSLESRGVNSEVAETLSVWAGTGAGTLAGGKIGDVRGLSKMVGELGDEAVRDFKDHYGKKDS